MTAMEGQEGELVLLVQVEREYDQFRVVGTVQRREGEEMLNPQWRYGGTELGAQYDGFHVHAYLGPAWTGSEPMEAERGLWGFGYSYRTYRIETAAQATAIAKVLQRLERGMDRLNTHEGYLKSEEFDRYLQRVARLLRLKQIWVRKLPQHHDDGQMWRKVTGSGLQMWIGDVERITREGNRGQLIAR